MDRRVTFNKVLGIVFMVFASFILYVSLMIGPSINTITGGLLLLVSIFYLVNPAIIYNHQEIQLKNLFGMTMKRYSFLTDTITVQNRDIYVNGSKIKLAKGMLARSEYEDLLSHILTIQLEKKETSGKPLKGSDDILGS
ncbi:MAG: hypothetical protein HYZ14_01225 [Bacteroidetes bacterium]|nr:hypothetical protein [Bacteroidota bacterium]